MKILIVDDDIVDRRIVKRALNSSSNSFYEIHESSSVAEGLEALRTTHFDVILLDYKMPGADGIEMVIELRAKPDIGNTAIIIISASEDQSLALNCIEAGAQDFLSKNEITQKKLEKAIIHAHKRFEIEQRMHESYLTVKKMAEKDPLTGLSNRYHFEESLKVMIASNKRTQHNVALLALDLDNFKHINDTMGHDAGDKVLVESVNRVQLCLRSNEGFARLGGDEFAVIFGNISSPNEVSPIANRILDAFKAPFIIDDQEVICGVSIGAALCPADSIDAKDLLKCADIAMYRSKQSGKNSVSFYQAHYQTEFNRRYSIRDAINHILDTSAFRLFYQPIFSSQSQNPSGFEALIRWPETEHMYVPNEFIPIAEESRLISRIDHWVIKTSIEQLSQWHTTVHPDLTMSINLSPIQLQDNELVSYLSQITQEFDVHPSRVILEITEMALIKDNKKIAQILGILSEKGFHIALDDFGVGFSSLANLMEYPIDIVKLDKSMQTTDNSSQKHRKVFEALALMLGKLEFVVVAEGIETEQQYILCKKLGLDRMQGFLLGKPLDKDKTSSLLSKLNYNI
jgi:diguanylate cyclase (GGDEF)-like protein